jgi:Bardet-Biedl syndrome 5 protein
MICVHVGYLNLYSLKHTSLYCLGFRIDPPEKLEETFQELKNLHDIYSTCPDFGVDFVFESEAPQIDPLMQVFFTKSMIKLHLDFYVKSFFTLAVRIMEFSVYACVSHGLKKILIS